MGRNSGETQESLKAEEFGKGGGQGRQGRQGDKGARREGDSGDGENFSNNN